MLLKRLISIVAMLAAACLCMAAGRYAGSGLAISVDRTKQTVMISHESIPGYLDAMVMPFHVKDAASLNGVTPGVKVEFTLVVDKDSSWLEGLHVVEFRSTERDPEQARRLAVIESIIGKSHEHQLAVGQAVPDFTLVGLANQPTRLSEFAGKVVALNFVCHAVYAAGLLLPAIQ